jgi:hypothetical protein
MRPAHGGYWFADHDEIAGSAQGVIQSGSFSLRWHVSPAWCIFDIAGFQTLARFPSLPRFQLWRTSWAGRAISIAAAAAA